MNGQYASETVLSPAVEIARQYNPRELTPKQALVLADRLLDSGLVSFEEHAHLRSHFARGDYEVESGSGADAPSVNLIDDLERVVARLEAEEASSPPPALTSVLGLLRKIEYLHAAVQ